MRKIRKVLIYCFSLIVTIAVFMSLSTIVTNAEGEYLDININIESSKEYDGTKIQYDIDFVDEDNNPLVIDSDDYKVDFFLQEDLDSSLGSNAPINAGKYQLRVEYIGQDFESKVANVDFVITKRKLNLQITSEIIYGDTPEWEVVISSGSLAQGDSVDALNINFNYMDGNINTGVYEDYDYIIESDNYEILTYSTWYLFIKPKELVIDIHDINITYGSQIVPKCSLMEGYELEFNDNMGDLDMSYLIGSEELTEDFSIFNQGVYSIDAVYDNSNYSIKFNKGKLSVKAMVVDIEVVAQGIYGCEPEYDYMLKTLLAYDDTYEDLGITYTTGTNKPSVGKHILYILSNTNKNYNIVLSTSILTISPRKVVVKIDDKEIFYGVSPNSVFTVTLLEGEYANGDGVNSLNINYVGYSSDVTPIDNPYIVDATTSSNNYDIEFIPGTLTILPKDIVVDVPNIELTYGEAKNFSTSVESLLPYGDTKYSLKINILSPETDVGQYQADMRYDNPNYNITFTNGSYTILRKRIEIQINDISHITYGETPYFSCILWNSKLSYGDTIDDLNITYIPESLNAGERYIIGANYDNANYDIKFREGRINIAKRTVKIIVNNAQAVYGDNPDFTYYLDDSTPLAPWDSIETLDISLFSDRVNADIVPNTISTSYNNSNYNIIFVTGYLTILPKDITIKVKDIVTEYGITRNCALSDLEVQEGRMAYNESLDALNLAFHTVNGTAVGTVVGRYELTITTNNTNYNVTVLNGSYTIEKRRINILIDDMVKPFGDKDPKFVFRYDVKDVSFTGSLSRESGERAGVYNITLGDLEAGDNYELVLSPTTLTIDSSLPPVSYVSFGFIGLALFSAIVAITRMIMGARIV